MVLEARATKMGEPILMPTLTFPVLTMSTQKLTSGPTVLELWCQLVWAVRTSAMKPRVLLIRNELPHPSPYFGD